MDELNSYSDELTVEKDFVLKASLVLADINDIKFNVTNFNAQNMGLIEANWSDIKRALSITMQLVKSFGLNDRSLLSLNAVIPIAYHLMRLKADGSFLTSDKKIKDRRAIQKWLVSVLLRGTFGSMADTILAAIRGVIGEANAGEFPVTAINDRLATLNRAVRFSDEEIESFLDSQYGDRQTFLVLSLLYPNFDYENAFHVDHIYPRAKMTQRRLEQHGLLAEEARSAAEKRDCFANLQLLQGGPNRSKSDSDFDDWLATKFKTEKERGYFLAMHHFPPMQSFPYSRFEEFLRARHTILLHELNAQLS